MKINLGAGRSPDPPAEQGLPTEPTEPTAGTGLAPPSGTSEHGDSAGLPGVEVVFRYRVPGQWQELEQHIGKVLRNGRDGEVASEPSSTAYAATHVALWQPVMGSDADVWELRLSFADHASLGRLMDDHPSLLASLGGPALEVVTAVEVANPVLRRVKTWTLGQSAGSEPTSDAD